ncbi:MAG: nicotinate (nicotinamide) nucleotide adenylyltransferase [Erysipelotrichaceae bacterium]
MKIGLFGGSFDPIHLGHLEVAKNALQQFAFDEIWFLLALYAPLKDDEPISFIDRYAMLKIAIGNNEHFKICTIEKDLPTPSYSANTLRYLIKEYPNNSFNFIIGDDQAANIDKWHDYQYIEENAPFIVFNRFNLAHKYPRINNPLYLGASSDIRQGNIQYLDQNVLKYIVDHQLYIKQMVKYQVSSKRFIHIESMYQCALDINQYYHLDEHQIFMAIYFHDYTKDFNDERILPYLSKENIEQPRGIWHQYASANLLKKDFNYNDSDVYDAIYNHTTGDDDKMLSMLVFCCDKIEPSRGYDSSSLIDLAKKDLKEAFNLIRNQHINFVKENYQNGRL